MPQLSDLEEGISIDVELTEADWQFIEVILAFFAESDSTVRQNMTRVAQIEDELFEA